MWSVLGAHDSFVFMLSHFSRSSNIICIHFTFLTFHCYSLLVFISIRNIADISSSNMSYHQGFVRWKSHSTATLFFIFTHFIDSLLQRIHSLSNEIKNNVNKWIGFNQFKWTQMLLFILSFVGGRSDFLLFSLLVLVSKVIFQEYHLF